jgi:hypothetical protein
MPSLLRQTRSGGIFLPNFNASSKVLQKYRNMKFSISLRIAFIALTLSSPTFAWPPRLLSPEEKEEVLRRERLIEEARQELGFPRTVHPRPEIQNDMQGNQPAAVVPVIKIYDGDQGPWDFALPWSQITVHLVRGACRP